MSKQRDYSKAEVRKAEKKASTQRDQEREAKAQAQAKANESK